MIGGENALISMMKLIQASIVSDSMMSTFLAFIEFFEQFTSARPMWEFMLPFSQC